MNEAVEQLARALCLTREYVGAEMLPAHPGWDWYEALSKYAPGMLEAHLEVNGKGFEE